MKSLVILLLVGSLGLVSCDFRDLLLECHNHYRQKHGAPPMTLSNKLNSKAQAWADKLAKQEEVNLIHSHREKNVLGIGENLFYTSGSGSDEEDVVDACNHWYSEIKDYNFANGGFTHETAHFTQMVWKGSTELGVGIATDSNEGVYVVANYEPGGNVRNPGYFDDNVLPAQM